MTECPAGLYCPNYRMIAPDSVNNQCRAGFYCTGGSTSPTPGNYWFDNGGIAPVNTDPTFKGTYCQPGNYCPQNSVQQIQCGAGTFLNYEGGILQTECLSCPAGLYCGASGIDDPSINTANTGPCDAGYYCTGGSPTAQQTKCPTDHYCPAGTLSKKICTPGEYTDDTGQATCKVCAPGKTCKNLQATDCPIGNYCLNNVITPCPKGKIGIAAGQSTESAACGACPAGKACKQTNIESICDEGYVCEGSAQTERPNSVTHENGRVCEPGYYCPAGDTDHTQCPEGFYCPNYAAGLYIGRCFAGYYCPNKGETIPDAHICK